MEGVRFNNLRMQSPLFANDVDLLFSSDPDLGHFAAISEVVLVTG